MSKASKYAEAVSRLENPNFSPASWIAAHGVNAATVAVVRHNGHLELRVVTPLEPIDALELGRWILDMYGEADA